MLAEQSVNRPAPRPLEAAYHGGFAKNPSRQTATKQWQADHAHRQWREAGLQAAATAGSKRQRVLTRSQLSGQASGTEQMFSRTAKKALDINLNPLWYGVIAEIGAGQEVARWFFRVGAAAGTIAKSVSAYDMTISDAAYGAAARYVTRERVQAMLDSEYLQCSLTLRKQRGDNTCFFAFADTVVARAFGKKNECHGWLGIKFQAKPKQEANTIMVHCRMLDATAQQQQEALGVLGVNIVHGALTHGADHAAIISSLMDDLNRSRMEVDLIDFSGPIYRHVDNRFAALRLVQKRFCDAALFNPQGELQIPQDTLRKKNVMLVRGRFRPFTLLHNDMLMGAAQQFFCGTATPMGSMETYVAENDDECVYREDTLVLLEMTTNDMMEGGDLLDWTSDVGIQEDAFIQRIEALSTMGYSVMISNMQRYFECAAYLSTFTRESIVIALGVPSLQQLFKESYYADLPGGILEGFGRLLKFDLKIYAYPTLDPQTGEMLTASNLKVDPSVQKLYEYILDRGTIVAITDYDKELLMHGDVSREVGESIRRGTPHWEKLVPVHVRDQIKSLGLLGYRTFSTAPVTSNGLPSPSNGHSTPAREKARA